VLAVTDVINQAKIPFVIFNTGTAIVTDQSPYFVRPTYTNYTHYYPLGRYAGMQGLKKCVAVAADYAPGQDSVVAVRGRPDWGPWKRFDGASLSRRGHPNWPSERS